MNTRDFDKRFKRQKSFINFFFGVVLSLILIVFSVTGYIGYNVYQSLDFTHGLKGIVNQVWYGPSGK